MNTKGSKPPAPPASPASPAPAGAPRDNSVGSGEGASTALEAMIRKRKQAETPDGSDPPTPPSR